MKKRECELLEMTDTEMMRTEVSVDLAETFVDRKRNKDWSGLSFFDEIRIGYIFVTSDISYDKIEEIEKNRIPKETNGNRDVCERRKTEDEKNKLAGTEAAGRTSVAAESSCNFDADYDDSYAVYRFGYGW